MDKLQQQIARARRRLNVQHFLGVLPWCWFCTLLAAAIAIGIEKTIWPEIDISRWAAYWIGGGVLIGLFAAVVWTWIVRCGDLEAAWEIDRRFGLKERASSSLALTADELNTLCGQALVEDAALHLNRLQLSERFPVSISRRILLPLAPAAVAVALCWLPSPSHWLRASQNLPGNNAEKQISESIKPLEKQIERRAAQAKQNGLGTAAELLKKIAEQLHDLMKPDATDRHETLAKLHDLTQDLEHRSEQLAAGAKLEQSLAAVKDIPKGPGEKLAQELKNGNFENALAELKQLQDQLARGKLSAAQLTEIAAQFKALSKILQDAVDHHRQSQDQLQTQLADAKQSGDRAAMQKLQQQIAKMENQKAVTDMIQQFADELAHSANAAQAHNPTQMQSSMNQLAAQAEQLEQQSREAQVLAAALSDIEDAKMAMAGKQGGIDESPAYPLPGSGSEGIGHRAGNAGVPSPTMHAKTYDSIVRPPATKGGKEASTGSADGLNTKGQALEQIKQQMQAARWESAEPLTAETLPRPQRDHAQQYFDAFRTAP